MLVKEVAAEFGGRVGVAIEEYGHSPMAERFGVRRYPVVFVDDVLVARPKDFGFGGPQDVTSGLYVPWREPANQRRFKDDLRRVVTRRLAGETVNALNVDDVRTAADPVDGPAALPPLALRTVAGPVLEPGFAGGRVVVVELWATWCPPCRSTLQWLHTYQQQRAADVAVVAVAVDSKPEEVSKIVADIKPAYHVVLATQKIVEAFGNVAAVPKLLVFDRAGRLTETIYGAPPDLHQRIDAAVSRAVKRGR